MGVFRHYPELDK